MTLKFQFLFLGCMGKAVPNVMLKLTPFFRQPSHQVSLILTCGCSKTQVCHHRAGVLSPSIRCGCLPHPSVGVHWLSLSSQVKRMLWSQGRGHPHGGGLCRVPPARLGVVSEGFGHSLEWAPKCLGKGGFSEDRFFGILLQRRHSLSYLLCVTVWEDCAGSNKLRRVCPSVCLLWHQCPAGSVQALNFLVIFL